DADIVLLDPLGRLDRRLTLEAAPRLDHVEGVQADEHAARDLERADRDAEDLEDHAATQGERDERDRAGPRPAAREHLPLRRGVAHGHGEEGWNDRERIHDEQDRREDQDEPDRPRPPWTAGGIEPTRASTSGISVNTTLHPAARR